MLVAACISCAHGVRTHDQFVAPWHKKGHMLTTQGESYQERLYGCYRILFSPYKCLCKRYANDTRVARYKSNKCFHCIFSIIGILTPPLLHSHVVFCLPPEGGHYVYGCFVCLFVLVVVLFFFGCFLLLLLLFLLCVTLKLILEFLYASSVVFAGFSAEALKSRILDGKSALMTGKS